MQDKIHDFIGIGIGPFNLSLACLTAGVPDLDGVFLDRNREFSWHPGLMLPHARMQTPFMADLVTAADPMSQFSFLNFLKSRGRLQQFCIRGDMFPLRVEFNDYCRWCAEQLPNLHFGEDVVELAYCSARSAYRVMSVELDTGRENDRFARSLIVGTGSRCKWPSGIARNLSQVVHSSEYLDNRPSVLRQDSIAVVGGGQSGAEVFLDLLHTVDDTCGALFWITRAEQFFPTEDTKFSLEMSTPGYVDYFYNLPGQRKASLLDRQQNLSKGARRETLEEIYNAVYANELIGRRRITLLPDTWLHAVEQDRNGSLRMTLAHGQSGHHYTESAASVVLATGYHPHTPDALMGITERLRFDDQGRLAVARNHAVDNNGTDIFVHNGDLHSHGVSEFDLGTACHRNCQIINSLARREVYPLDAPATFQKFGPTSADSNRLGVPVGVSTHESIRLNENGRRSGSS